MNVLLVVTSTDKHSDNVTGCGWYLPTVAFSYLGFIEAGYNVTIASPLGGEAPLDTESAELWDYSTCAEFMADQACLELLKNTHALKDIDASQYQIVFVAGGFGALYDIESDATLHSIIAQVYEKGGIVSTVGCGAAALLNVRVGKRKSTYMIAGAKLTALTEEECQRTGHAHLLPFKLHMKLSGRGALFQEGEHTRSNVVTSGRLVTGQNPSSTAETVRAVKELHSTLDPQKPKKKESKGIIICLTNTAHLGDGSTKTGWLLPSLAYLWVDIERLGKSVAFVSPYGGNAPLDPESATQWAEDKKCKRLLTDDRSVMEDMLPATKPIRDIDPLKYNAIIFCGGEGAMVDFPEHTHVNNITAKIYEDGGIVCAVSHGVAGLLNVKLSNGKWLVEKKHVTSPTDEEVSRKPHIESLMPFKLQARLNEQGALFVEGPPTKENVVVSDCGRIITGQNANSCVNVTQEFLKAYKQLV